MILRILVVSLCVFDAVVWLLAVYMFATPNSETDTADYLSIAIISLMYLVSGVPAFVLAIRNRAPTIALSLAGIFPVALAMLFMVTFSPLIYSLRHLS